MLLLLVVLHLRQSTAYAGLNVRLSRSEIGRECTVRDFCLICILVVMTTVKGYDLVPKGAHRGGSGFDCQQSLFQTLCLVVALCVRL